MNKRSGEKNKWTNELTNNQRNEWKNDWMNEEMNERMIEWTKKWMTDVLVSGGIGLNNTMYGRMAQVLGTYDMGVGIYLGAHQVSTLIKIVLLG